MELNDGKAFDKGWSNQKYAEMIVAFTRKAIIQIGGGIATLLYHFCTATSILSSLIVSAYSKLFYSTNK